jgi:hypothetical protein
MCTTSSPADWSRRPAARWSRPPVTASWRPLMVLDRASAVQRYCGMSSAIWPPGAGGAAHRGGRAARQRRQRDCREHRGAGDDGGPGEILASRTVRDLVAGSDVALERRGTRPLEGVEGNGSSSRWPGADLLASNTVSYWHEAPIGSDTVVPTGRVRGRSGTPGVPRLAKYRRRQSRGDSRRGFCWPLRSVRCPRALPNGVVRH